MQLKWIKTFITVLFISLLSGYNLYGQVNLDSLITTLGESFLKSKQGIGLSIGIYNKGVSTFYNFGTTNKTKSNLPTRNTVYEIGSIAKTFVSFILASAVVEKKLALDDDIRKYIKGNYPNLEYNGHPIRLVHLANTTSLLPDWLPPLPAEMKSMSADSALNLKIKIYKKFTKQDFFKALHTVKLDTLPGTKRYHSNAGAQLLAYILEDVYKMPVDQLIRKYITQPNQMNNTSFIHAKTKNLATGYTSSDKVAVYEFVMPYFRNAGGLGSTAFDLVQYIRLLFDSTNKSSLLSVKKTADINASTGKLVPMRPDNTSAPDVYSTALNWFKYKPDATSSQIWADGGTNGFNSYLVLYPHLKSGIVILANKSDEKIFRALPGIAYEISKSIR